MKLKALNDKYLSLLSILPIFFAAVLFFFMLNFNPYNVSDEVKQIIPGIPLGIATIISAFYLVFHAYFGKIDGKKIITVMFLLGFALRLMYSLKFGFTQNQHDVESLVSNGHLSYINMLALGEGLPKTNDWQYCHPPLHHFLSSLIVRFSWSVGLDSAAAFENVQLLTCFYSSMLMFAGYSLLKECKVDGKALIFSCAFLVFHPTFYILAGSINNDILTLLLSVYALLFLVKWYNKPTLISALACGIFTGLAMMTKFSAALVAAVAAITVFIKCFTDKNLKFPKFAVHTGVFLAVMLPLGLWYQVRNGILFDQPLGYVAPLSTENKLYIGDMSIVKRLIMPFSSEQVGVYTDVWNEYNLWQYLLRNSLFGEYNFGNEGFASVAVFANLLVIAVTVAAFIWVCIRIFKDYRTCLPIVVMFIVQWVFFIYFNITSPFRCSMDFRYIVPVLFCSVVFMGAVGTKAEMSIGIFAKLYSAFYQSAVIVLLVSSVLVFI